MQHIHPLILEVYQHLFCNLIKKHCFLNDGFLYTLFPKIETLFIDFDLDNLPLLFILLLCIELRLTFVFRLIFILTILFTLFDIFFHHKNKYN